MQDLPDFTHSVKVATVPDPTKENLTAAWKSWVQSAGMHMVGAVAVARSFASRPVLHAEQACYVKCGMPLDTWLSTMTVDT